MKQKNLDHDPVFLLLVVGLLPFMAAVEVLLLAHKTKEALLRLRKKKAVREAQ